MPFSNEDRKRVLFAYWDKLAARELAEYRDSLRNRQMAGTGYLAKAFAPRKPDPDPHAWNPMKKTCPPENIQN